MSSEFDIALYRVSDIVSPVYDDMPVNVVDFTLHLQPQITLDKVITKDVAGRPTTAEYYYDGVMIADIHFDIQVDTNTRLMTTRKETLHYYKYDGTESPDIIIKDRTYNLTSLDDLEICMAERENARKAIFSRLKAFTLGVIQQYNPTYNSDQVVAMVKDLWNETSVHREDFVELGDNSFRDYIAAIDLNTTPHTWLSYQCAPSVTLQDYYVGVLTY